MLMAMLIGVLVGGLIYYLMNPPAPRICGSLNGPPVTSPRIRLKDGRHLAYKLKGTPIENAKYKVLITHGFCASKDTFIPVSDSLEVNLKDVANITDGLPAEWLLEMGICIITFDRPGYVESDPNPNRSPKNDAFDIQELVDQLELGTGVYVIGLSMGAYPVWGCLKYLPHRFAGMALIVPVVNYWWPSLPSEISSEVFNRLPWLDQCRLGIVHHSPKLAWVLQRWLSFPTVGAILKNNPKAFNESDMVIIKDLSKVPSTDKDKITQQGEYESLHRDIAISFGSWEFNPLDMKDPYPDKTGSIHLWMGREDGMVAAKLLRYVAKRLPWINCHEVPKGGHLFIHDQNLCKIVLKSLLLGEQPCFE